MSRCSPRMQWPLLLCMGLLACAGSQTGRPADGPKTADELLRLASARAVPRTLQGMSRLDSYVDGQTRKADVLLRLEAPDRIQFQILSPTLDLLAVLSTDGKRFVSYERGAKRCYQGEACARNLSRLVPIELPPKELVAAIMGRPPLLPSSQRSLHWDGQKNAWRVHIGGDHGKEQQDIWVEHGSYAFIGSVVLRHGKRVASIAYGGRPQGADARPPKRMRLQLPLRKVDMSLELREVSLDEDIDAQDFAIPCPAGTLVVTLPCEATRSG